MRISNISPMRLRWKHLLGKDRELHAIWSLLVNARTVMMLDPARRAETGPGTEDGRMLLSSMVEWVRKGQRQSTAELLRSLW